MLQVHVNTSVSKERRGRPGHKAHLPRCAHRKMIIMQGFRWSASSTEGVTHGFSHTRILGTSEGNVMDVFAIRADTTIWAVCLPYKVQRRLGGNAISTASMQKGMRSFYYTVMQNWGRGAVTSDIFVGITAVHALVNDLSRFEEAVNVDSWAFRVGARSQHISVHIYENSTMRGQLSKKKKLFSVLTAQYSNPASRNTSPVFIF